jgi:hypothetical protein
VANADFAVYLERMSPNWNIEPFATPNTLPYVQHVASSNRF